MSEATLRQQIRAMLLAVPGVGVIHDYERWTVDPEDFLKLFQNQDGKIYGWEITRSQVVDVEHRGAKHKITHEFRIKGYYGLKDSQASDKSFNAIIDSIIWQCMSNQLPGSVLHTHPKVPVMQMRMFGAALCHYAEMVWQVPEIVAELSTEEITDLLRVGLNYYLTPGDDVPDAADLVNLQGGGS